MTLTNLARYDKGVVRGEAELTKEGYIKTRAIVTRCGVFLYKNADGTVRKELRHPDNVLEPESLETIKMIPVVNGHPPERLVNADNSKRLSIGFTGETVEEEMPHIISSVVVTDKDAVEEIKKKRKNELSLGYTVDLIPENGSYNGEPYDFRQTNIRYNHLALVDVARAGPEARIALDGQDAHEISKEEFVKMSKSRKVKMDTEEYLMEDNAADKFEGLMKAHQDLMGEHEKLKNEHEKMTAERDSLRDKDHHNPEKVHHPLENDEIGSNGKEEKDPIDTYGMQSHVRDYTPPSKMENHVVNEPKNQHYPNDLPKIPNVDAADVNRRVKQRVQLEKLAERFLDRQTLQRLDSLDDLEVKKRLIMAMQPNARLDGKSEVYISARFDSALEDMPKAEVVSDSYKGSRNDDNADEKDRADSEDARTKMIKRQKNAWKPQARR